MCMLDTRDTIHMVRQVSKMQILKKFPPSQNMRHVTAVVGTLKTSVLAAVGRHHRWCHLLVWETLPLSTLALILQWNSSHACGPWAISHAVLRWAPCLMTQCLEMSVTPYSQARSVWVFKNFKSSRFFIMCLFLFVTYCLVCTSKILEHLVGVFFVVHFSS